MEKIIKVGDIVLYRGENTSLVLEIENTSPEKVEGTVLITEDLNILHKKATITDVKKLKTIISYQLVDCIECNSKNDIICNTFKEFQSTREDTNRFPFVSINYEDATWGQLATDIKIDNIMYADDYRICSECGEVMYEGFVINAGDFYYCDEECLHKNISEEDYAEMYEECGDTYWTQFC